MAKSGKMKNTRWFRIVCATLTYIYTIAICNTSEVVEELVCMGRWRPPGALHVHLGSAAAPRAAAIAASVSSAIATTRLLWRSVAVLAAACASGRVHAHYYILSWGRAQLAGPIIHLTFWPRNSPSNSLNVDKNYLGLYVNNKYHGHTKSKSLILCSPNSNPNPK